MLIYIYKFITIIFHIFVPIYLHNRIRNNKEIKERLNERYGIPSKERSKGNLIWFHAASIGESLSILTLVEEIKKNESINQILITTGTKTSADLIGKKISGNVVHQFLPLDVPIYVNRFINFWQPNLAIFVESEIWPNLISAIKKNNVEMMIINGRMTLKSFKRWMRYPNTAKKLFSNFSSCCTQNNDSLFFFEKLGIKECHYTGNLKFTSLPKKINKEDKDKIKAIFTERKILVAASTHPEEEEMIIKITNQIREKRPDFISIIAPRHPNRKNLTNKLNEKSTVIRSTGKSIEKNTSIYLADTFGELDLFYSIADFIFIGGSFVNHGGQNPIEASFYGKVVNHGKFIQNFTDVYSILNQINITNLIDNPNQLKHYIETNYNNSLKESKNDNLKKIKVEGEDALNSVLKIINEYIPKII